ncbi:uncharacterized protein SPSK_06788 [Sporothrix schenckii 1099-18]|uniref:Uncharacterized protein n=1 Tax=Sporothrix schenckii 1099-18 TaxID=1397361 RepID=A0A0F2MJF2_SPOSC|nr:uncharacterized protein SPSK_06788 [Sporothrix schenckii 1099-18]KJR89752.1 hypothetical protein SPSK_06788 [Sporothrix schenckii 1099-18]
MRASEQSQPTVFSGDAAGDGRSPQQAKRTCAPLRAWATGPCIHTMGDEWEGAASHKHTLDLKHAANHRPTKAGTVAIKKQSKPLAPPLQAVV